MLTRMQLWSFRAIWVDLDHQQIDNEFLFDNHIKQNTTCSANVLKLESLVIDVIKLFFKCKKTTSTQQPF